jgi:hypothetical protein
VQGVLVEKLIVAEQEKVSLQEKIEEEKSHMKQEKEQLLTEQLKVKEVVNKALRSVAGLEIEAEDRVPHQVDQLMDAIHQLQKRIADLEIHIVPSTPQDVRDQREANAWSTIEKIKALAMECKQLSDHSAQTYERLTENLELKALESQLQKAKQQVETIHAQLKPLSIVERMKWSQEQCTFQQ